MTWVLGWNMGLAIPAHDPLKVKVLPMTHPKFRSCP